jgi:hypothetical protein
VFTKPLLERSGGDDSKYFGSIKAVNRKILISID